MRGQTHATVTEEMATVTFSVMVKIFISFLKEVEMFLQELL